MFALCTGTYYKWFEVLWRVTNKHSDFLSICLRCSWSPTLIMTRAKMVFIHAQRLGCHSRKGTFFRSRAKMMSTIGRQVFSAQYHQRYDVDKNSQSYFWFCSFDHFLPKIQEWFIVPSPLMFSRNVFCVHRPSIWNLTKLDWFPVRSWRRSKFMNSPD